MEPTQENLRAWNDLHRRWAETRAGAPDLGLAVREQLPDLTGKHVLHLTCGTGELTAELLELGALVTGIDRSEDNLVLARERAPDALFLVGDIGELPAHLRRRRFEAVYAGPGLLDSLADVQEWVGAAAAALRANGELIVHDVHPVAKCLDPASLRWRLDYFELTTIGELVTATAAAGLRVTRLAELRPPVSPRRLDPRVPSEFVLVALKSPA
jgi:ubiquinone/menaquinone biosynthesis C-methylase UbiE